MPPLRRLIFSAYWLAMLALFFVPVPRGPVIPSSQLDKAVHFVLFLGFAALYRLERGAGVLKAVLVSALFAGGVELVQELLGYRSGELMDFVAGIIGAMVGAAVAQLIPQRNTPLRDD